MKTKLFHAGRSTLSVVLAVMMLLSTMLMGSLSTVTAATVDNGSVAASATDDGSVAAPASGEVGDSTQKIYFANTSSWSSPYIWAWTDSTNYTGGTWAGQAMTEDTELTSSKGIGIYYYELNTNAGNIIFSDDGSSQTATLTPPSGWDSTEYVYDLKNSEWVTLDSYTYSSSTTSYEVVGSLTGASWTLGSGYAMTESNGTYTASFSVTSGTAYYFKINDKSNTTDWSKCYYTSNSTVSNNTRTALTTGNKDASAMQFTPTASGTATITFEPGDTAYVTVTYPSNGSSSSGSGYYLFGDGNWTTGVELDSNYSVTVTSTTGINLTNGFLISKTSNTSGNVKAGAGDDTGCTLVKDGDNLKISSFDDGYGYPVTLTYDKNRGTVSAVATAGSSSSTATIFYSTETSADSYKSNATEVAPTETKNDDGSVTYSCTFNTIGDGGLPVKKDILFTYADTASTSSVWAESSNGFNGGVEGYISTGNFGINNYYYNDETSSYTNVNACKVYIQNTDVTSVTVSVTKNSAGTAIGWDVTGTYNATARLVAKNGTIRTNSNSNYNSITDDMGTTTVTYDNTYIDDGVTIDESSYQRKVVKMTEAAINKGLDLTISTQMTDTAFANYYIAGYVIDGETYALQEDAIADYDKATQTVSFTYRVPLTTEKDDVIEVTPVYFMKSSDTIRFYVEDYENVKNAWGDTLACYAYYSTGENDSASFNQANGFGCYPGQPMLKTGGRYFYDLPSSITVSSKEYTIKGITLNNYKWDDVHGSLVGSTNYQTYDYSDFGTIYNQKIATLSSTATKPDIIFAFKYTAENTGTDHFGDGVTIENGKSTTTPNSAQKSDTALGNVTENLTDFYGDRVDLFHTNIETKSTVSNNPWIAISNGYENCNDSDVGYYATRWAIYKPSSETGNDCSYSYVTSINSASLFYSSAENLKSAGYTTEATAYTTLLNEGAANQPVVISYEKEITRATSLDGTSADGDQTGARSDGVWYYSEPDITVTAHTVVQYATEYKSTGYSDSDYITDYYQADQTWDYNNPVFDFDVDGYDAETTSKYYGQTTGLQAYFSYTANNVNYWRKTEGKQDADGSSGFYMCAENAKASDYSGSNSQSYQFDGWYKWNSSSNTYTFITSNAGYWTVATGNDVYVARFSPVPTDTVTIQHLLYPSSTGTGTLGLTVKVQDASGDTVWQETETGSAITVPAKYIATDSTYKIVITLNTTPDSSSTFTNFYGTDDTGTAKNTSTITSSSTTVTAEDSDGNTANGTSSDYDTSSTPKTVTVTYNVSSLYPSGSSEPMSVLDLYSKIDVDLKVLINYNFETRYYGQKVYQVVSDNNTSVNSAAETVTLDDGNWTVGSYIVKNGTDSYGLSTACLIACAPDETNFNQSFSWDVDNATQDYSNGIITVNVNAKQIDDYVRYATIKYVDESGEMQTATNVASTYPAGTTDTDYTTASYHWYKDGTTFYETASTYNGDSFSYWEVSTLNSDGTAGDLVTYVYTTKFNYTAFDNYYVEAVYGADDNTTSKVKSTSATVTELADTRNHWNNTTTGSDDSSVLYNTAQKEYDRLYIDFALSFEIFDDDGNAVILNPQSNEGITAGTGYKVGFVIAGSDATEEDVKSTITSGSSIKNKTIYVEVESSELTNKNRTEYCYGVKKSETTAGDNAAEYTVYAFVYDGTTVTLSDAITVCYGDCLDSTNTAYQTTTNS